jgi:hypothetical protein
MTRTPAATAAALAAITPTPLKTILSRTRYPFAVACVKDGKIVNTFSYATTLEECYALVQGWRSSMGSADYIMAEQQEIGEAIPDVCVNTYWVAV